MPHMVPLTASAGYPPPLGTLDTPSSSTNGAFERFRVLRALLDATPERMWRFADLHAHIDAVERMIFALDDQAITADLFLSSLLPVQIALQQFAYCHWETELERRFVQNLSTSASIDEYALTARFRRLIHREIELLSADGPPSRLLFIGSGPCPISAILAHEYMGIGVDCLDADGLAVVQSRRILEQWHLSSAIRVFHGDGMSFDASNYDAVIIALLAKPKSGILGGLARTLRRHGRVVCRASHGLRVLLYEPMNLERELGHFTVRDQRSAVGDGDTISSLLLQLAR
jgi:hypothetical protein